MKVDQRHHLSLSSSERGREALEEVELGRREIERNIRPSPEVDAFMKVIILNV